MSENELAAREAALTEQVLASFAATPSPRLKELLEALVGHLHAFAREVRLTEEERSAAIDFLTRTGQISDERRQEFILLSDVLGLSMLTIGIGAPRDPAATEPTVFGPFFVHDAPFVECGGDIAQGAPGEPCRVEGVVTDTAGTPIPHAEIEVWGADAAGRYDVQYDDGRTAGRARLRAGEDGRYGFWSVRPVSYPIPDDGPVGELLAATRRSPMRPAHIHFMVTAPGHRRLVTHVFSASSPHLDDDAVFGVKRSLVRKLERRDPEPGPAGPGGRTLTEPWWRLEFDIALARERDTEPGGADWEDVAMSDYTQLPEDLPVPVDDGAADHLRGMAMPSVVLEATDGREVDLGALGGGRTVIYIYPMTGTPGVPLPEGWDEIPGARGCTPETLGFRDHFAELRVQGADAVYGLSTQDPSTQRELVVRLGLPYPLLADPERKLGAELDLPSFSAGGETRYHRLTLIISDGEIEQVFYPIFPPHTHAIEVLGWLSAQY